MEIFSLSNVLSTSKSKQFVCGFRRQILKLSVCLLLIVYATGSSAQGVQELGQAINSMKLSSVKAVQDESIHLNSLVNDLQPTLYINSGVIKTYNNTPCVCADVDILSINKLSESNSLYSQIELIKIRINPGDASNLVLNLATLQSFTNLKYVIFLCSFDCNPALINNMYLPASGSGVTVLYQISIPN
jgi:hypothetical protein